MKSTAERTMRCRRTPGRLACVVTLALASCLPAPPADQPSPGTGILVEWTVNGMRPDEWMCRGLGPGTVSFEVWENADFVLEGGFVTCPDTPGHHFYVLRFDCNEGTCMNVEQLGNRCFQDRDCAKAGQYTGTCARGVVKTPDFFFSDVPTCLRTVLMSRSSAADEEDVILGEGPAWQPVTPPAGGTCTTDEGLVMTDCLDFGAATGLGTVNFTLQEFGALVVELDWQVPSSVPATFEPCDPDIDAGPPVKRIGFSLVTSDGAVLDSLEIDRRIEMCREELAWPLVPFGSYSLTVEGRDESRSIYWTGTCENLEIPSPASRYRCDIPLPP
jgi:hypothetical protein